MIATTGDNMTEFEKMEAGLVYDCNVIGVIDIGMNRASFVRDPVVCRNGRT